MHKIDSAAKPLYAVLERSLISGNFLRDELFKKQDYFSKFFLDAINEKLPQEEGIYLLLSIHKYDQALLEFRKGNESLGNNYLLEAANYERPHYLIPNKILATFSKNIIAYKEYKRGNYPAASGLTIESMAIDTFLENHGFPILHFHKIQCIHNISRIFLKQRQNEGLKIALALLTFLSKNGVADLHYLDEDISKRKNSISDDLTMNLFLQIFSETIHYIMSLKDMETHSSYLIRLKALFTGRETEKEYVVIFSWLNMMHGLLTKGFDNLHAISKFIDENINKLKYLSIYLIGLVLDHFHKISYPGTPHLMDIYISKTGFTFCPGSTSTLFSKHY